MPEDRLVTIATFSHDWEANLARIRLEEEDIESVVTDDVVSNVNWLWTNAIGGVKVQVRESDTERAVQALEEEPPGADAEGPPMEPGPDEEQEAEPEVEPTAAEETVCPACGSSEVCREALWSLPMVISVLLLWFPLPFVRRRWVCMRCGTRWKKKRAARA